MTIHAALQPRRLSKILRGFSARAQRLVEPTDSVQEPGTRRQMKLLSAFVLILMALSAVGAIVILSTQGNLREAVILLITAAFLVAAYQLSRTRRHEWGALITVTLLSLAAFVTTVTTPARAGTIVLSYIPLALLVGGFLLRTRYAVALVAIDTFLVLCLPAFIGSDYTFLQAATVGGVILTMGVLIIVFSHARNLTERDRLAVITAANQELQIMRETLEERVQARTVQLRTSADVGRAAVSILDTNQLLREIVNLITDRFGFYYAAVFVADSANKWAVLREATGEAGRTLKERQHQLEIGGQSMVGTAMKTRKARIALDAGDEAVRFANPLLPETRSEIALPLVIGSRVIGALDVQSTQRAAFDEASAAVLQTMADQIAIALSNTLQFNQTQSALRRSRQLYEAGRALTAASDVQGILNAFVEHATPQADRASALLFGPQTSEGRWSHVEYGASWIRPGLEQELQAIPTGTRLTPEQLPVLRLLKPDEPLLISDVQTAELNPDILLLLQRFGAAAIIGIPLNVGRQSLGFIMIGFRQAQVFDAGNSEPLMALASQAAIAIQNQRTLAEAQATLRQLDEVNRRLTGRVWRDYALTSGGVIRQSDVGPSLPPEHDAAPLPAALSAPIVIRGQEIGTLRLEDAESGREWTPGDKALLQTVAGEVAIALENARLIEQAERRAQREHLVADISSRMLAANDIESILRTAGDELGHILRVGRVAVQLSAERPPASDEAIRSQSS